MGQRVRVQDLTVSADGYVTGEGQSLDHRQFLAQVTVGGDQMILDLPENTGGRGGTLGAPSGATFPFPSG